MNVLSLKPFSHLEFLLPPVHMHHHLFLLLISDQRLSRWCPLSFLEGMATNKLVILKTNQKNTKHHIHCLPYTTQILPSDWLKWLSPFGFSPQALSFHFCQCSPAVFSPSASLYQPTIAGTRPL